jgi:cysteine desulfurase/selenocysteine lyase
MPLIEAYEQQLLAYGTSLLQSIRGVRLIGTAEDKAGVLSFLLDGYRTDEVAQSLSSDGIAVRGGHHCAQPILRRFGLESTVRPSLAFYNDCSDLDALARSVARLSSQRGVQVAVPSRHAL